MYNNNDEARAALFVSFSGFQAAFTAFLAAYAKSGDKTERTTLATSFVKAVAIPYIDTAKDGLLAAIVPPMLAIDADLTKLLHVFGGGGE
jgi:tRNA A37 threonylcarbamoyltransferase TsaD